MAIADDIAAIRADGNRSPRRQQLDIYNLKSAALLDIIRNGKPAPNPVPPLLGRTFTLNGTSITVNAASLVERLDKIGEHVPTLYVDVTLVRGPVTVNHRVYFVNPPVIPNSPTGNERQDLIAAAQEILSHIPVE